MAVLQTVNTITLGGTAFSVYGTHADAIAYFQSQLQTTGFNASSFLDQQKALVEAVKMLERQDWLGTRTDPTTPQPLDFPRVGLVDQNGEAIASSLVPLEITMAEYELAHAILKDLALPDSIAAGSNTKKTRTRDKVGDLETEAETEYFGSTLGKVGKFPTIVQELTRVYLSGSATLTATATGTSGTSLFASRDFTFNPNGLP